MASVYFGGRISARTWRSEPASRDPHPKGETNGTEEGTASGAWARRPTPIGRRQANEYALKFNDFSFSLGLQNVGFLHIMCVGFL